MASPQPLTHSTLKGPSHESTSERRTAFASAASAMMRSTFRDIALICSTPLCVRKDAPSTPLVCALAYTPDLHQEVQGKEAKSSRSHFDRERCGSESNPFTAIRVGAACDQRALTKAMGLRLRSTGVRCAGYRSQLTLMPGGGTRSPFGSSTYPRPARHEIQMPQFGVTLLDVSLAYCKHWVRSLMNCSWVVPGFL
jgi:hypothetical protein